MKVEVSTQDEITVVAVTGEVDGGSAPGLQAQILPLLQQEGTLILDLGGVPYMSSAGLRILLLLYRQAVSRNGRVALAGLEETIKDTMAVTGFLKFFTVVDSVEQALTTLKQA
ncbi:MAG: anti-sigma factor antagonist [Candidatus Competibacteraceae bacterium]|nr:anti-sigma factor antagonist [Candidatus Competibacteraceae bacterium]